MHEDTGNIFSKLPSLMLWQFDISLLNVCEGVTCINVLCLTCKSKILPNPSVLCRVHQLLSGISSVSLLNKPVLPFFFFVFVLFLFFNLGDSCLGINKIRPPGIDVRYILVLGYKLFHCNRFLCCAKLMHSVV